MERYEELLGRVVDIETQLQLLHAEKDGGVPFEVLISRVNAVETTLHGLKQELVWETARVEAEVSEEPTQTFHVPQVVIAEAESRRMGTGTFRVRNVRHVPNEETGVVDEVTEYEDPAGHTTVGIQRGYVPKPSMEFKVGKTVMSILASLLILCSMVLFGGLLYPYISDGMKVIIMYALSVAFIGVGLVGRERKYKTFFTALSGCGVGAFYLSGIISYFMFNAFGLLTLAVLTYAWICAVGWISRGKVRIFAYICYVGILISTALCVFQFEGSPVALWCYLLSIVTLYLFNRTDDYNKDAFYFVQFPFVMLLLAFCYVEMPHIVMWMLPMCMLVYVVQYYLYHSESRWYMLCMLATQLVMFLCYKDCCESLSPWTFLNLIYVVLTGLVSIWSYLVFQDKLLKFGPMCIMSLLLPLLEYGSWYESYAGFAPFAIAILLIAYLLDVDLMKGIACGYMLVYMIDKPYALSEFGFYMFLVVFMIEFGVLFGVMAYHMHRDRIGFMLISWATLMTLVIHGETPVRLVAYIAAIAFSALFNSLYFVEDDLSQRLAWGWNGFWMACGASLIATTDTSHAFTLTVLFLAVLVSIMLNVKWQLGCENLFAGLELCIKWSLYIWMLLEKLQTTGVVMSVAFLLLAIWCIVLGALVRRKVIRLYGLLLAIVSVVKCLLLDIQYSSSLYRPVGLLVAGVLCFGISWLYSVIERKLHDSSDE